MDEELRFGGKVVVDDVVQQRDVDPPRGQVGHQQDGGLLRAELCHLDLARGRVERAVAVGAGDAGGGQQLETRGAEGSGASR